MLARMWRMKNTPPFLVGFQACTTTLENSLGVSQKTVHSTTRGFHNTSLGHISRFMEHQLVRRTHSIMFITTLFIIARSWKEPRCPSTEEWTQKMWYIYTMEYYSAIKKHEFMKFLGKWTDLEGIILSEVTQSQKNSNDMYSLISGY